MRGIFYLILLLIVQPSLSQASYGTLKLNIPSGKVMRLYHGPSAIAGTNAKIPSGTVMKRLGPKHEEWYRVSVAYSDGSVKTGWMYDGVNDYLQENSSGSTRQSSSTTQAAAGCVDCEVASGTSPRVTVGSGAFANYQNKPKIAAMIKACKRIYGGKRSADLCLQGVRISGQSAGALRGTNAETGGLTSWASKSGPGLKAQGYINLLQDPLYKNKITGVGDPDIPVGAILVYDGTNGSGGSTVALGRGIGHAEIKTGSGSYCSDFTTTTAGGAGKIRPGKMQGGVGRRTRRLKGVWVKPGI